MFSVRFISIYLPVLFILIEKLFFMNIFVTKTYDTINLQCELFLFLDFYSITDINITYNFFHSSASQIFLKNRKLACPSQPALTIFLPSFVITTAETDLR